MKCRIVLAGKHRKTLMRYCYQLNGIRIKRVHGGWTYQLILKTIDDGGEDEINKSDPKVETRDYESDSSIVRML